MSGNNKVKELAARLDAIGYCRPPRATQWKPGQSGNPNGRPKVESFEQTFRRLAASEVVTATGEKLSGSGVEHILRKMFDKAVNKGNPEAARIILALAKEYLRDPASPREEESAEAPADASKEN